MDYHSPTFVMPSTTAADMAVWSQPIADGPLTLRERIELAKWICEKFEQGSDLPDAALDFIASAIGLAPADSE